MLKGKGLPQGSEARLDLSEVVARKGNLQQARIAAGEALETLATEGDAIHAVHVMTYARLTEDRELLPAIRQRLAGGDTSWAGQHVKLGAMHALVVLEGETFSEEISGYLQSEDASVKSRAFMLARDSGDRAVAQAVRAALAAEEDPGLKAAGLSALARLEGGQGDARRQLEGMARQQAPGSGRARMELNHSGQAQTDDVVLSRAEEEKYRQMAMSGRHDERMFAIEELAVRGSEGVRGWLRRLGEQEDWRHRMKSAYYLLAAGESDEALSRLENETHPLVQVTLLAALRVAEPENGQ